MKKTFLFLAFFAVAAFTFMGCKKEDETPESYILVGENKFIISGGDIIFEGMTPTKYITTYSYSISLNTSGLTYSSWDGYNPSYSGNGVLTLFHLRTTNSAKPAEGDYPLTGASSEGYRCSGAGYEVGYSTAWYNMSEFDTGKITIAIEGDTYTLNYEGNDEYGVTVKLFFTGKLAYHDESDYFGS